MFAGRYETMFAGRYTLLILIVIRIKFIIKNR